MHARTLGSFAVLLGLASFAVHCGGTNATMPDLDDDGGADATVPDGASGGDGGGGSNDASGRVDTGAREDSGGGGSEAGATDGAGGDDAAQGDASGPDGSGGGDAASPDAGTDAGADAGKDAGVDAGTDAGTDAGMDAGADGGDAAGPPIPSVLTFHNHATRDGVFVDPALTTANAAKMHLDTTFKPTLAGNVYAQPLYLSAADGPGGKEAFLAATESNNVYAIDSTGKTIWTTNVGSAATNAEKCGNIKPLGITGTPVVDLARRAVYLDAARPVGSATTLAEHEIHALSIDTGKELAGWPVKASSIKAANNGTAFVPNPQNERSALLVAEGTLYVPYGGHAGDCTDTAGTPYHGWVVGVPLDHPAEATGYATDSAQAGIWSVGGLAFDGTNLFASTGNGTGGKVCPNPPPVSPPAGWAQQESLLRLQPGPVWSGKTNDYFAPLDWPCLDNGDKDVGGSSPVLVDLPGGSPSKLVVGLGKDGFIYVVDRTNLGGVGNAPASMQIISGEIKMAPAAYTTAKGTYVVAYGSGGAAGMGCPAGQSGSLVAVKITPGTPPKLSVAWCAASGGDGSPIFTTSDGASDPLVWSVGAGNTNLLHAWNADTGAVVFGGGGAANAVAGFHAFSTVIVANGRIVAGANNTLYAFTPD